MGARLSLVTATAVRRTGASDEGSGGPWWIKGRVEEQAQRGKELNKPEAPDHHSSAGAEEEEGSLMASIGSNYGRPAGGGSANNKKKATEHIGKKRKPGAGKGPIKKKDDRMTIQPVTRPRPRAR